MTPFDKGQIKAVEKGEPIVQETRRWNAEGNFTSSMRSKEMAHDYRYFPDPDLMPVKVDEALHVRQLQVSLSF